MKSPNTGHRRPTLAECTNLINLTPHAISIICGGNNTIKIAPSGTIARVATERQVTADLDGIPIYSTKYGAVTELPEPREGTVFIVSALVRQACPNRRDVFSPGELIRDASGQPIGCRGLDGN